MRAHKDFRVNIIIIPNLTLSVSKFTQKKQKVVDRGLEPRTLGLLDPRSNQLS